MKELYDKIPAVNRIELSGPTTGSLAVRTNLPWRMSGSASHRSK